MRSRYRVVLLGLAFLAPVVALGDDRNNLFSTSTLLKADGKIIDTGATGGHAGPCLIDLDDDGLRDLVVGDYQGKFLYYRNVGSEAAPKYSYVGLLQSEGADAKTHVYCCIAASPTFCDLNGDGVLDLVSGCYSPGSTWWFPGIAGNDDPLQFGPKQELVDAAGKKIRTSGPASWPMLADLDSDGDLDLVWGTSHDGIHMRDNIGTPTEPLFDAKDIVLQCKDEAGGKIPMDARRGHAAVTVADWDGDGLLDILTGCYTGGVFWFRNCGTKREPAFDIRRTLIEPLALTGNGLGRPHVHGTKPDRGIRTQVFVTDYNHDGLPDLLVGDYFGPADFVLKPDATPEDHAKFLEIANRRYALLGEITEDRNDFWSEQKEAFSGTDEEFRARWKEISEKWEQEPAQAERQEKVDAMWAQMKPYFNPDTHHAAEGLHGHIWVYLRKSAANESNDESSTDATTPAET